MNAALLDDAAVISVNISPVFPVFFPVTTKFVPRDKFDCDCRRHHAVWCKQRSQPNATGSNWSDYVRPRVYSYEELLRAVANAAGIKPRLFPVPFAAWGALARICEMLPNPPITRNQVELMLVDNTSSRRCLDWEHWEYLRIRVRNGHPEDERRCPP
jgi:hypothetical protein